MFDLKFMFQVHITISLEVLGFVSILSGKSRRSSFYEVFNDHETTFNSQYESFFKKSESDSREHLNWNRRSKTWHSISDSESDDDIDTPGSSTERALLGLPPSGPLKIEDVKKA